MRTDEAYHLLLAPHLDKAQQEELQGQVTVLHGSSSVVR